MKVHVIIDFMHIYYKYFFQLREGKLKRLSAPVNWNGTVIEKDTSLLYYPLRDIEGIRRQMELNGHDTTISVCFDSPSKRKDEGTEAAEGYKSGRKKVLSDEDFKNLEFIQGMLDEAGHNTYKYEGYEADDIVNYLVRNHKDEFDYNIIYTNDKDLIINVCDNVGVMRFKQYKGYTQVERKNYEEYLEEEFGTFIPYNALGLFLSTVGDSADKIKGINKFGKVAFKKLITKVACANEIDWTQCGDYDRLEKIVYMCKEFLTDEQFEQLVASFVLVANMELIDDVPAPTKKSELKLRETAYLKYNMLSLCP